MVEDHDGVVTVQCRAKEYKSDESTDNEPKTDEMRNAIQQTRRMVRHKSQRGIQSTTEKHSRAEQNRKHNDKQKKTVHSFLEEKEDRHTAPRAA